MSERGGTRRALRETASFRFPAPMLERLDRRANQLGVSRTTLAERLLDEGIRQVEHPGIVFTTGAEGERRATIAGTRLDVWFVVEAIRANNDRTAEAADYLGIPARLLEIAARYYAAFPDDIERELRIQADHVQRERRLADERERLLG